MSREFCNGEYYHIYNRGVEKRAIFEDEKDYLRFYNGLAEFNDDVDCYRREYLKKAGDTISELIEVTAYCLNPNHYHLILKQLRENGVSEFMRKLGIGYTGYFNRRHVHSGVLFQGQFQSKHILNNNYLLWLSVYVNLNNEIHRKTNEQKIEKLWQWSSYNEYIGNINHSLCKKNVILGQFNDREEYRDYCKRNFPLLVENKKLKDYFLE
jgi:putative transposase